MTLPISRATAGRHALGVTLALLVSGAGPAPADLLSENGAFGADTLTRDTASGLRWLDLTLSTNRSYGEVLAELGPGGVFEGYRFGTGDEVATLFEDAGIDVGTGLFVPENYDPIVALTALIGQTGEESCGSGCTFAIARGWYDSGGPTPSIFFYMTLSWFDNSAPLSTNYPQAPIGRVLSSTTFNDAALPTRGAWLVEAPEPAPAVLARVATFALAAAASCRRGARR